MTKRFVLGTCVATALFAATVGAQAPAPAAVADEITVVGCVAPEEIAVQAPGAPPVSAKPPAGTPVELALVVAPDPAAPAGTAGASGTPTGTSGRTATSTGSTKAYRLSGNSERELSQHVGQKVEIEGKAQANRGATAGAQGGIAAMPMLEIVKFRVVPGDCK